MSGVAWLLAAALFLAPALGATSELMLQDTLKSIVVAVLALVAAIWFSWRQRAEASPLTWHAVLALPLLLLAYALGSMAWSHTYLAGVEAVRWFVFAVIAWLGLQVFTPARLPIVALAIHGGAVVASLWAVLQFWMEFGLFPQGPNPASTFINRNFFAEFAVCTLPFGALLLARARSLQAVVVLGFSLALVTVAILMTGTRSALISLWLQLLLVLPLAVWKFRGRLTRLAGQGQGQRLAVGAAVAVLFTVGLGLVPASNDKVLDEGRGKTAIERAFTRTASIGPNDSSFGLRRAMWAATLRLIEDHPVAGVGAGAWEVHIPRYQPADAQLETDYYVHNEVLQLLAEYGVVGLLFLAGLFAYLVQAARRTWGLAVDSPEPPWRAAALASLLSLLLVSNAGFPWRMAATGALFAACLGLLAASDARLGIAGRWRVRSLDWRAAWQVPALVVCVSGLALALFVSWQAAQAERKLVRAAQLAAAIAKSRNPNDPALAPAKAEVLRTVREGIALNPHYRKITPVVADAMSAWGDWKNATWIWESVLASRPYIVAILTNAGRGHVALDERDAALQLLERARAIAPQAPSVLSLEVIALSRFGDAAQARAIARSALQAGRYDQDLLTNAFVLGLQGRDPALARDAFTVLAREHPQARPALLLELARFHLEVEKVEANAIAAWRQALAVTPPQQREQLLQQIPEKYRAAVRE